MPTLASAHEVYVLSGNQIAVDATQAPFDMIAVALQDMHRFIFWGFIAALTVAVVFCISIMRPLERALAPFFNRARRFAPFVSRITIGLGLLAGAYYGALFGPELPLSDLFGPLAFAATLVLALSGACILLNIRARLAALAALALFASAILVKGSYMLTYTNYLGEIAVLLIGAHEGAARLRGRVGALTRALAPYSFAILRICFGISLLFASAYAKILHNNLALQVASLPLAGHPHSLAYYFGFEPHFLVLGAALIEIVIGAFFLFGFEIRFTALFMEFWLMLSLFYFGEAVWPHIILIGIPIAFFLHGYDRYSLEGRYLKKGSMEPVM